MWAHPASLGRLDSRTHRLSSAHSSSWLQILPHALCLPAASTDILSVSLPPHEGVRVLQSKSVPSAWQSTCLVNVSSSHCCTLSQATRLFWPFFSIRPASGPFLKTVQGVIWTLSEVHFIIGSLGRRWGGKGPCPGVI